MPDLFFGGRPRFLRMGSSITTVLISSPGWFWSGERLRLTPRGLTFDRGFLSGSNSEAEDGV